jgi:hypothetical protein
MSESDSTAPEGEEPFACLRGIRASLENFFGHMMHGFPDLEEAPQDCSAVLALLSRAQHWAEGVLEAHGVLATDEIGLVHPEPVPVLVWFPSGPSHAGIVSGLDRAVDVVGELPHEFRSNHAISIIDMCRLRDGKVRLLGDNRADVSVEPANWPTIAADLHRAHLLTIVQGMKLIGWLNARIDAFRIALVPHIRHLQTLDRNNVIVAVTTAGVTRRVELTNGVAAFLDRLVLKGPGMGSRKAKMTLVELIPELLPWISSAVVSRIGAGQNESPYKLAEEARGSIESPLAR